MFSKARQDLQKTVLCGIVDDKGMFRIKAEALPEVYTLSQLHGELVDGNASLNAEQKLENLLVLLNSLSHQSKLSREPDDEDHIKTISVWISQSILPDDSLVPQSDMPSENEPASIAKSIYLTRQLAKHGFECLNILQRFYAPPPHALDFCVLLAAIAYSSRDPWTDSNLAAITTAFLSAEANQTRSPAFIVEYLLQGFIRPLFSRSRPSTVTESGRKAIASSEPPKRFDVEAEKRDKPWKYRDVYTVTVLEWAVANASVEIVSQNWNLFIPPLLTLLDDPTTLIRSRGLKMLSAFLPKFPPKLLAQTGLGPVFEDAILPTVLFLPSITPVEESLQLLPPAYMALEALGEIRFSDEEKEKKEKMKFLDRVIRKGILLGYYHASVHHSIVEVLLQHLSILVFKMGIHSVKHLKDIVPIISTTLMDPFATPSILHTTLGALSAIIQNTWPRISQPVHRRTIMMALVVCWRNIVDSSDDHKRSTLSEEKGNSDNTPGALFDLKKEMISVSRLFVKVIETEVDMKSEFGPLIKASPGVAELFGL